MKKVGEGKNDPEGSWECPFCHNINWPKRTTCNKEGCHMPKDLGGLQHPEGSWACTSCTNVNWPKRTECNKCRVPRNGLKVPGLGVDSSFAAMTAMNMGGAQPGSWVCPNCANVNWPARTFCNKPSCQTPKPQALGAATYGLGSYGGRAQGIDPYMQGVLGMAQPTYGGNVHGSAPPGSWSCPSCGNVNWPKRTTCNKPGCGASKPGHNPDDRTSGHPEGSWICTSCANVNWPQRTICNKPGCQAPRS